MLDKEPDVTPEWGDQYLSTETLLPRRNKMSRDHMVCHKHDVHVNLIDRSNQNPILDTWLYEVEFSKREKTGLAANIITELMYAQSDANGNEYLLLEAFSNHRKIGSTLNIEDQKIVAEW